MVVYVDVLLFVNTVMDYLMLSLTAKIIRRTPKLWRKIVGSLAASMFSLYIFLPAVGFFSELLFRLISSASAVIICFGFKTPKKFFSALGVFYAVSFLYAGMMMGVWMLFRPERMSVNNGVVYFNISPLVLITASFVFYVIILIYRKLTKRDSEFAKRCSVTLSFDGRTANADAMVDSGHTLTNMFGDGMIMIIDRSVAVALFNERETNEILSMQVPDTPSLAKRYRLVPIKTVSGENLLPAVKVDFAEVISENRTYRLAKPVAVISRDSLGGDYAVIIPPEALLV